MEYGRRWFRSFIKGDTTKETYTIYAIRKVGEIAVIQANSKDEAIEKVTNEDWEVDTDLNWEITSVKEDGESWESEHE